MSTVKKSHAAGPRPGCAGRRARRCPGLAGRAGSPGREGSSARSPHRRDSRGGPVHPASGGTPGRVLRRKPQHQVADLLADRRAAWPRRISPLAGDQTAVPCQQGSGGHDPVQPQAPGQQPGQGGEHGTVSPVRPRARDLTVQDSDLMPQYEDLRVLDGVTARQQRQPAEHTDHGQVDEANKHERRA